MVLALRSLGEETASRGDHLVRPDARVEPIGPSGQLTQRGAMKKRRSDAPVPGDRTPLVYCSCVRSVGDRGALRAEVSSGRFRRPVRGDRTRPVGKTELWELSGLDRTPEVKRLSFLRSASGQCVSNRCSRAKSRDRRSIRWDLHIRSLFPNCVTVR